MSEWITDRRPTEGDCVGVDRIPGSYHVWVMYEGKVVTCPFEDVVLGCPWQPIAVQAPEPYVKPQRYRVKEIFQASGRFAVYDFEDGLTCSPSLPTIEAAERIAAIYEEVMP